LRDAFVPVDVSVYPLHVERVLPTWKEDDRRQRAWVRPHEAAALVDEPALVSLLNAVSTVETELSAAG
jgi:hypothetical protein